MDDLTFSTTLEAGKLCPLDPKPLHVPSTLAHVIEAVNAIEQKGGRAVTIKLISPFSEYLGAGLGSEEDSLDHSESVSMKRSESISSSSPPNLFDTNQNNDLSGRNWDLQQSWPGMIGEGVLADPLLFRVLYNLLSNAVKFSPLEGEVTLSVAYEVQAPTLILTEPNADPTVVTLDQDGIRGSMISSISMTPSSYSDNTGMKILLSENISNIHKIQNIDLNDSKIFDEKNQYTIPSSLLTTAAVSESGTRMSSEKIKTPTFASKVFGLGIDPDYTHIDRSKGLVLGMGGMSSMLYNSNSSVRSSGITTNTTNTTTNMTESPHSNMESRSHSISTANTVPILDHLYQSPTSGSSIGYDIDHRLDDTVTGSGSGPGSVALHRYVSHVYDGKIGRCVGGNAAIRNILRSRKSSISDDNEDYGDAEEYDDSDNLQLKIAAEKLYLEQKGRRSRKSLNRMGTKNLKENPIISTINIDRNTNKEIDRNDFHHYNSSTNDIGRRNDSLHFSPTVSPTRKTSKVMANFTFHFHNQLASPLDRKKLQKYFDASNVDFQSIFSEDTDDKGMYRGVEKYYVLFYLLFVDSFVHFFFTYSFICVLFCSIFLVY